MASLWTWLTAACLLSSWSVVNRIRSQRAAKAFDQFAAQHGCEDPKVAPTQYPFGLDLLYNAYKATQHNGILHFFKWLVDKNGHTFAVNLLGTRGINTVDPENLEALLSSQFEEFSLGERREVFFPLLGDGIFTQDGQAWRHSRSMLRPQFSDKRSQNYAEITTQVENLIACITTGESVDLQPLFFRFTLDTTTYLLFGESINSLSQGDDKLAKDFAEAFRISQKYMIYRIRLGKLYWLINPKEFREACRTVHAFVDEFVAKALSKDLPKDADSNSKNQCFLDSLVRETRDPQVLRDQLLNMLLAGRDTTACCLSWTFRMLVRHQHILKRLRDEIQSVVGLGADAQTPTRNDLKKMGYLSLVFKEVLRLYPSVPVNTRLAVRNTTIPRGGGKSETSPLAVRAGEAVGYSVYVMHRREDIYGPDALEFRPERWELGNETPGFDLANVGWGYLPFNNGPRFCLGQEFALVEASYAVVRLIQEFPFMSLPEEKSEGEPSFYDDPHELTLVMASTEGCRVRLHST